MIKRSGFASPSNSQELLKCTGDLVLEVTDDVLDHERARTSSSAADRPNFLDARLEIMTVTCQTVSHK